MREFLLIRIFLTQSCQFKNFLNLICLDSLYLTMGNSVFYKFLESSPFPLENKRELHILLFIFLSPPFIKELIISHVFCYCFSCSFLASILVFVCVYILEIAANCKENTFMHARFY